MSSTRVLLDAGVVSRIFRKFDETGLKILMESFEVDAGRTLEFVVPTPVCYELGVWNKNWYEIVYGNGLGIPNYASFGISGKILKRAARYIVDSKYQERKDDDKQIGTNEKISMADSLIAAYSLELNLYIMTFNQIDFVPKCFELVSARAVNQGHDRLMIYLLRPKLIDTKDE